MKDDRTITEIVAQQAEDDGLWFIAQYVTEAYLQVALRRLHAAIERDGWQPIETAPRFDEDDKNIPVLILRDGRRYVARYDPEAGYFFGDYAIDGETPHNELNGRLYGATHWMPLPDPPAEQSVDKTTD